MSASCLERSDGQLFFLQKSNKLLDQIMLSLRVEEIHGLNIVLATCIHMYCWE